MSALKTKITQAIFNLIDSKLNSIVDKKDKINLGVYFDQYNEPQNNHIESFLPHLLVEIADIDFTKGTSVGFQREGLASIALYIACKNVASGELYSSFKRNELVKSFGFDKFWTIYDLEQKVWETLDNYADGCGFKRLQLINSKLFRADKELIVFVVNFSAYVCDFNLQCGD